MDLPQKVGWYQHISKGEKCGLAYFKRSVTPHWELTSPSRGMFEKMIIFSQGRLCGHVGFMEGIKLENSNSLEDTFFFRFFGSCNENLPESQVFTAVATNGEWRMSLLRFRENSRQG